MELPRSYEIIDVISLMTAKKPTFKNRKSKVYGVWANLLKEHFFIKRRGGMK
jgi:hypothetical protein